MKSKLAIFFFQSQITSPELTVNPITTTQSGCCSCKFSAILSHFDRFFFSPPRIWTFTVYIQQGRQTRRIRLFPSETRYIEPVGLPFNRVSSLTFFMENQRAPDEHFCLTGFLFILSFLTTFFKGKDLPTGDSRVWCAFTSVEFIRNSRVL